MFTRRLFLLIFLLPALLPAQGFYPEFGQNRVQYGQFDWKFFSDRNVDVYFTKDGQPIALKTLDIARNTIPRIEKILGYRLSGSIQLLLFNSLSQYRQSNLGYVNPQITASGYQPVPDDQVAIYFNGDYNFLGRQIRSSVTEVLLREMMYGGTIQERVQNSALLALPPWYLSGLKSYLSEEWNADLDNRMHDAIATGLFRKFNSLSHEDYELAGHSIWKYLLEVYGQDALTNIIYMTRTTRSVESAIYFVTQQRIGAFIEAWEQHYTQQYNAEPAGKSLPQGSENAPRRLGNLKHTQFIISPDGQQLAIVTNDKGLYQIWLYHTRLKTTRLLYTGGHKVLNQIPDYHDPILAWKERGKVLSVLSTEKGEYMLRDIALNTKTVSLTPIRGFIGVHDFIYKNNDELIISAIQNGQSDLYQYRLSDGSFEQLTNDIYFDHSARLLPESDKLVFISNRPVETGAKQENSSNLFLMEGPGGKLIPLTRYGRDVQVSRPLVYGDRHIWYLCDGSGIVNSWQINWHDSLPRPLALTNYKRSIIYQDYAPDNRLLAELLLINGRYKIFITELEGEQQGVTVNNMDWRRFTRRLDSLSAAPPFQLRNLIQETPDTSLPNKPPLYIDSGYYSRVHYLTGFDKTDPPLAQEIAETTSVQEQASEASDARLRFTVDHFQSQFDNSILGSYYFTNLLPPDIMQFELFSPYLKASISDRMKDYSLDGGIRVNTALNRSDILFRFSDMHRRLDKEFSVVRRARPYDVADQALFRRSQSTTVKLKFQYPLNEREKVSVALIGRQERILIKSSGSSTLFTPDISEFYSGLRFTYVFDNTDARGLNHLRGLRMKLYNENWLMGGNKNMWIFGGDVRYYLPLHRQISLCTRLTGASSSGSARSVYYLGAMENWIKSNRQYESGLALLNAEPYVFQSIVGNMRGFSRNIRSGNNYLLMNAELRIPLFAYLYQKPIRADFWRNFMFTGFIDAGTAWVGSSPWSRDNPFNTRIIDGGAYRITVTSRRNPLVMGAGFGMRSRVLGYYLKYDYGWGLVENRWNKGMSYFTWGLDF